MSNKEALLYLMELTDGYWYDNFQLNFYHYFEENETKLLNRLVELGILFYTDSTMISSTKKVFVDHMEVINHKAKVRDNKINSILDIDENE